MAQGRGRIQLATISQPQQKRSRHVLDRIVDATLALLQEKRFEEIAVAEIARRAKVAVGTVYTRFPSKHQLLFYVFESVVLPHVQKRMEAVIAPRREESESLYRFVFDYLWAVRETFLRHREILRPLTLVSRESTDAGLHQFMHNLNTSVHEHLLDALLLHRDEIKHPQPEMAAQMALLWVAAAMREKFLYGEPVSSLGELKDEAFVGELARGVIAYLTCDQKTGED